MKINKAGDNNVVMLCKNCYKEIKKSCGKISKYNEYVHKETGYMYCTLNQYILDSKAELLEVSILCKHCNKPIIKCYRCYHNKCLYIASIMFVILMWSLPYWLSCSQPCYF